jgi:hypothetical protein
MSLSVLPSLDNPSIEFWLPGETLFSLASRHHVVSCNCFSSDTCHQLFGHCCAAPRHDFPTGIDFFVKMTGSRFGGAERVIFERTLLPFYLPLNSKAHAEKAIRSMRGDRIGSLRYSMGMLLNHFRDSHPLRACELCMREDIDRFGVAYWHRIHQIPGVWCCLHHQCPLMVSSEMGTFTGHYNWCLPRTDGLISSTSPPSSTVEPGRVDSLERFAYAALGLTALAPRVFLDGELLARVYADRLVSMGLRQISGKLRLSDCVALVLRNSAPLRAMTEMSALPATEDAASAYVSKICWRPAVRMHPLLHLFTIVWLFGDWAAFWHIVKPRLARQQCKPDADLTDVTHRDRNALYRQALADVMAEESRR